MKKLIILDASTTEIHVYSIPNANTQTSESIEDWIAKNTTHRQSECSWMLLPQTYQIYHH